MMMMMHAVRYRWHRERPPTRTQEWGERGTSSSYLLVSDMLTRRSHAMLCLAGSPCQAFLHTEEGYVDRLKAAVPGGFHVIVEMLANQNLEADFGLAAKGALNSLAARFSRAQMTYGTPCA
jgi:hypothetical protein